MSGGCERHTHTLLSWIGRSGMGTVAASAFLENCFAIVLATSLRTMSPTTIPLTHPSGLLRDVKRPNLMASRMTCEPVPLPTGTHRVKSVESASLSSTGKKWSDVIPAGPGAAPRRALSRKINNSIWSSSICSAGSAWTSRLNPSLGGLRSGESSQSGHCAWCHGSSFQCLSGC